MWVFICFVEELCKMLYEGLMLLYKLGECSNRIKYPHYPQGMYTKTGVVHVVWRRMCLRIW
jgi:hypothetical protein